MSESAMPSIKIGLVGPSAPPAGGMAAQAEQLLRLLQDEGIEVEFLQTNRPYKPKWVGRFVGFRSLFRLADYLWQGFGFIRRVDVVHLMSNSGWSWQLFSAPIIWLGALFHTPVIVNYRGGEARQYFLRAHNRVEPSLRRAKSIIVPSPYLQSVFSDFGHGVDIIPNIIDSEKFYPIQEPTHSEPVHGTELIVVRNLEDIYGIDVAIKAMAAVVKQCPACRMRVAGTGPVESKLRDLVRRLGLEDSVTFEGRLDRTQVADFYRSADVFVNASRVDNMPNSLLEAMACGIAIASTSAGGIPYMVENGKTALLSPVDDPELLAQSVLRLIESPELRQSLVENGLEEIKQYRWENVKSQWCELYASLIAEKTRKVVAQ